MLRALISIGVTQLVLKRQWKHCIMLNGKLNQWGVYSYNFGPRDLLRSPKEYSMASTAWAMCSEKNYWGCFLSTELSKHCRGSTNSIFHSQPAGALLWIQKYLTLTSGLSSEVLSPGLSQCLGQVEGQGLSVWFWCVARLKPIVLGHLNGTLFCECYCLWSKCEAMDAMEFLGFLYNK